MAKKTMTYKIVEHENGQFETSLESDGMNYAEMVGYLQNGVQILYEQKREEEKGNENLKNQGKIIKG